MGTSKAVIPDMKFEIVVIPVSDVDRAKEFYGRLGWRLDADVDDEWRQFVAARRAEELERIIIEESLNRNATHAFVDAAFRDGAVQSGGTAITTLLPPVSRFSPDGGHGGKKQTVIRRLTDFFERFFGLS